MGNATCPLCPLRLVTDMIGGKWKMPLLCILAVGDVMRYGEIQKKVPAITNMMLSQSLKELEQYHLIRRKQYDEVPLRVEYSLTETGKSLMPLVQSIHDWGSSYGDTYLSDIASQYKGCTLYN